MNIFKTGDKVRLASGSEPMTVISIYGPRLIECEWEGKEGKKYKHCFRPESLVIFTEQPELKPEEEKF